MLNEEKKQLSLLSKDSNFINAISKLTKGEILNDNEKVFILSCSIIFLKYYEEDNRFTSYLEFAYYIILKYSIIHDDYKPLFDFSINFGFFPISKKIYELDLIKDMSINDILLSKRIEKYKHNDYIETYRQKRTREKILNNYNNESCFIAPTSFGKSSVIIDYIKTYKNTYNKICVIVPSRSLLMQTYKMIKTLKIERKIIIHDEMYNDEEKFVAILTQERTLRMIEKKNVRYDLLFIDEAHNIFNKNSRSILLARAIRKSKSANKDLRIIYLSPLISDKNNLMVISGQKIYDQKIDFNIKEPEIFEYKLNGNIIKYNRFLNKCFQIGDSEEFFSYINENSLDKNFIYLGTPKKIEIFANDFSKKISTNNESKELDILINMLKKYVHEDFYAINYLKKGIVYLHGQLPELIKEYLEYNFKKNKSIKYLIANTVVLEGMNLPLDCLFIVYPYRLHNKEIFNLIGRVNRLNYIFDNDKKNKLYKLIPKIHFVNSEKYNRKNSNMFNKISELRSRIFKDDVNNPILINFDLNSLSKKNKEKALKIIELEKNVNQDSENELEKIKQYLIKEGFNSIYDDINKVSKKIEERINKYKDNQLYNYNLLEIIYIYFIKGIDNIKDFEIRRLQENETRYYYENYIKNFHKNTLKQNIISLYKYFKSRIEERKSIYYIGGSFGEINYKTKNYKNSYNKVYIDLSNKNDKELINISVIKIELENKFIHYKLNKFVVMLYDFGLINDEIYYKYIYGTTDENKIKLARYGLSIRLIRSLDKFNQLKNITINKFNNLEYNEEFKKFINNLDDLSRFEILRNFPE